MTLCGMGWVVLAVRDNAWQWPWRMLVLAVVVGWHVLLTLCAWVSLRWALRMRAWPSPSADAWALGLAWCGADAMKQLGWQGHGYALVANGLVDLPGASNWLPWIGSQALATCVCLLLTAMVMLAMAWWRPVAIPIGVQRGRLAAALLLPLGVYATGGAWQGQAASLPMAGDALSIVVVHPASNPMAGWNVQRRDAGLRLVREALQATPMGGVVVTTEDFFGEPPPAEPEGDWAALLALRDAREAHLLVGMPLWAWQNGKAVSMNAVWQLSPGRNDVFAKQRLVPGAEYLPWPGVLDLVYRHVFPSAGKKPQPAPPQLARQLQVAGSSVGLALCHEVSFALTLAARADGAQWLLNVADDSWLDSDAYRRQALNIARLRAMELGKPLLRVVNGARSVLVAPDGSLVAGDHGIDPDLAAFRLQPRQGETPYRSWATAWAWMPLLAAFALLSRRAPAACQAAGPAAAHSVQEPSA